MEAIKWVLQKNACRVTNSFANEQAIDIYVQQTGLREVVYSISKYFKGN